MNRRRIAFLAPLFAVLAMLLGLTEAASAAFNPAAQNPHYGNFLLRESEVSTSEWLQLADPIKEKGEWIYDGALGVPVYVRQNPWTMFDPDGLFEWSKVGQSLSNTVKGIGELGQDAGNSINEILWLGAAGFEANGRFNQKALNIGKGLVESGGKAIDAAHLAAGGNLAAAGEKALTILGDTPEEAVANGGLMVLTAGTNRYFKGTPASSARGIVEETTETIAQLTPEQTSKLKAFDKKNPANSTKAVVDEMEDGNVLFTAESQGNNKTSKKVYQKTVTPEGETTSYTKTTVTADRDQKKVTDALQNPEVIVHEE